MFTGQIMIYVGIGLIAVALVLGIVISIVFHAGKDKMKNKIYSEYQES